MKSTHPLYLVMMATLVSSLMPSQTMAHGFAGKRFFPATMAVDDPFVADEAGLVLGQSKALNDEGVPTNISAMTGEYAKTITPRFGVSFGTSYLRLQSEGDTTRNGFDNLDVGVKYLLHLDPEHETLLSIGASAQLGATGSAQVGASSETTLSPALFFGKGFGDLPQSMRYLRPLAITGVVSPSFATQGFGTQSVDTGLTFQYNLNYLQSYVKDLDLPTPLDRMIAIVELPLSTCTTGDCRGQTRGTVNPGLLWVGKKFQLGLEAALPINHASGSQIGMLAQVHFFVDDLFPHSLGRPIFK